MLEICMMHYEIYVQILRGIPASKTMFTILLSKNTAFKTMFTFYLSKKYSF